MVASQPPAPTKTDIMKKATELQKGAGHNLSKHDQNSKRDAFLINSTYKVMKKSAHRDKEAKERKREKVAAAVAQKNLEILTIAMFDSLAITKAIDVTRHGAKVTHDVGIWEMFGEKPIWYTPLPVVDPKIVDLFPFGKSSTLFTKQVYPLSDAST